MPSQMMLHFECVRESVNRTVVDGIPSLGCGAICATRSPRAMPQSCVSMVVLITVDAPR